METGIKKISLMLLSTVLFISCERAEIRGFFTSYDSVNERFKQSQEWNNGHPLPDLTVPTDDYVIFAMGDSHVGTTENLDRFLSDAKRDHAIAAVMVGDLTTGHAEDFETFYRHLPLQDTLVTFQMVGNHDLYFDGWKQFFTYFGSSSYFFTVKTPSASDLFICLDSGGGTLGSSQMDWLKEVLEIERPGCRRCIIFTHLNLFRLRHTLSANPFVEELRVLTELFVGHSVDMVISGHDHLKNSIAFGNTTIITMDALIDGFRDAGYLILEVKDGFPDYKFINFL